MFSNNADECLDYAMADVRITFLNMRRHLARQAVEAAIRRESDARDWEDIMTIAAVACGDLQNDHVERDHHPAYYELSNRDIMAALFGKTLAREFA